MQKQTYLAKNMFNDLYIIDTPYYAFMLADIRNLMKVRENKR